MVFPFELAESTARHLSFFFFVYGENTIFACAFLRRNDAASEKGLPIGVFLLDNSRKRYFYF